MKVLELLNKHKIIPIMAWIYLFLAGIFEIIWTVSMKYCDGFKLGLPLLILLVSMILSVAFLGLATKAIPLSISYAVWTGIGIIGVFVYDFLYLKSPISTSGIVFLCMILVGIIGLKLSIK